ncbi:MAG: hypothetical protein IJR58_02995 [Lachnospiraceae bacterium]|nr:hypothetical protein [Lachnospiraceae bacterium]
MKEKQKAPYTEVWGDTVVLSHLCMAAVICIVLTMIGFLTGRHIFLGIETLEASLARGYSLLTGILGCFIGATISARMFKPKRVVVDRFEESTIQEILDMAGMTMEEEIEGLQSLSADTIQEMEDLELWSLLALIPEGARNYKPEYREKASAKEGGTQ